MAKANQNNSNNNNVSRSTQSKEPISVQKVNRPDHRWLIIGPKKSGSVFHKDPNGTSAWNACIRGKKKWILFPPHMPPPGVFPSKDGGAVETPVSVMEWFFNFYKRAQSLMHQSGQERGAKNEEEGGKRMMPMEGVVNEGELIYVPRGWWHCVLNLEDSIAITHNFCSARGLPEVLKCLQESPHTISGVPEAQSALLYDAFRERLIKHEPCLLEQVERKREDEAVRKRAAESKKVNFHEKVEKKETDFVLSSLWE
jgi:hypothetical protein